jgi:hypothetical protein
MEPTWDERVNVELGSGSLMTGNSLAILAFLVLPSRGESMPRASGLMIA